MTKNMNDFDFARSFENVFEDDAYMFCWTSSFLVSYVFQFYCSLLSTDKFGFGGCCLHACMVMGVKLTKIHIPEDQLAGVLFWAVDCWWSITRPGWLYRVMTIQEDPLGILLNRGTDDGSDDVLYAIEFPSFTLPHVLFESTSTWRDVFVFRHLLQAGCRIPLVSAEFVLWTQTRYRVWRTLHITNSHDTLPTAARCSPFARCCRTHSLRYGE